MPQDFKVNDTNFSRITTADWLPELDDQALDGNAARQRDIAHVWRSAGIPASDWNTLSALEGQKVSITTTDYSDRNASDYATYYGVDFERISGRHEGPVVVDVVCEFLVRV